MTNKSMLSNDSTNTFSNTSFHFPAFGKIRFNLTNDYLFHVVFQENKTALKGLISALLNLDKSQITSIKIKNPIVPGENQEDKTFILDLLILLNHSRYINLEMQVKNNGDWSDRSLSYLCRIFDHLSVGEDYSLVLPAQNISFLDFPFPNNSEEFHATYQLKNIKNNTIYSDKFTLSVVQLNQTEKAEPEDIENGLVDWIQFFKATDWKEVFTLANKNFDIASAAESMYSFGEISEVFDQCWQREEDMRIKRSLHSQGLAEGKKEGEQRFASLAALLTTNNLTNDLLRAVSDLCFREELYKKYNL